LKPMICTSLSLVLVPKTLFHSLESKHHAIIVFKGVGANRCIRHYNNTAARI
jgi:hypothetical protein